MRRVCAQLCALLSASVGACASAPPPVSRVDAPIDAIVVLGHRPPLRDGRIEKELRARVEHGVALYRSGRASLLVMSGGESTKGVVEADVMADHAAKLGVPVSSLLRERASKDTIGNARLTTSMLRARLGHRPRVLLVTSDYHSERAARLLLCAGAEVEASPVDPGLSPAEQRQRRRSERWVRFVYTFFDECDRARSR